MRRSPKAINTPTSHLAGTQKAIISYRIGKRDGHNTDEFVQDLHQRVLGAPEISTDGYHPYKLLVRDAFRQQRPRRDCKDSSDCGDLRKRCGAPLFAGRSSSRKPRGCSRRADGNLNLLCRARPISRSAWASRRFTRLTNGFSKEASRDHAAAIGLYVAHYNFCRVHEALTRCAASEHTSDGARGSQIIYGPSANFWIWRLLSHRQRQLTGPRSAAAVSGNRGRETVVATKLGLREISPAT